MSAAEPRLPPESKVAGKTNFTIANGGPHCQLGGRGGGGGNGGFEFTGPMRVATHPVTPTFTHVVRFIGGVVIAIILDAHDCILYSLPLTRSSLTSPSSPACIFASYIPG